MSQHMDRSNGRHHLQLNLSMHEEDIHEKEELGVPPLEPAQNAVPTICGMPLKYVSLVTLAVQNATLTLIMHYSRVSSAPSETYSAAAAVLLTELLKGSISLLVAFSRIDSYSPPYIPNAPGTLSSQSIWNPRTLLSRFRRLGKEVFRPDCWKLSIPAILYVIQNNLQFVAVSNLEAATFQVSYQMKILTTAVFSVFLLRKKLSPTKWLALFFLAIGVGIVQIQSGAAKPQVSQHEMNAVKGFMAVVAACFTSGLAGVYFEMVLKNSPADLWVRNVQLSLFSLLPALVPIIFSNSPSSSSNATTWFSTSLFQNFGVWAWATVLIQVLGGLLTALVIKYADNILKGFATSLSIVISFLASVALFNMPMTLTFILGSTVVLVATWMYNQPEGSSVEVGSSGSSKSWSWRWRPTFNLSRSASAVELTGGGTLSRRASTSSLSSLASFHSSISGKSSYPGSPVERDAPILGQFLDKDKKSRFPSLAFTFGGPFNKATKAFSSRVTLFRSASYTAVPTSSPPPPSQPLEQPYASMYSYVPQPPIPSSSSSYPPSRPSLSLSSYPVTVIPRPSSALAGSASESRSAAVSS